MNLANLTGLLGLPIAIAASVLVPLYLNRSSERRAAAKEAVRLARAQAEGTEVSWEAINRAIVKERDTYKKDLLEQAAAHKIELAKVRERHQREIEQLHERWERSAAEMRRQLDLEASELKQRYDEEMSSLSTRLAECQKQVSRLYGELYELQKLLPPGIARPWPGTPG